MWKHLGFGGNSFFTCDINVSGRKAPLELHRCCAAVPAFGTAACSLTGFVPETGDLKLTVQKQNGCLVIKLKHVDSSSSYFPRTGSVVPVSEAVNSNDLQGPGGAR